MVAVVDALLWIVYPCLQEKALVLKDKFLYTVSDSETCGEKLELSCSLTTFIGTLLEKSEAVKMFFENLEEKKCCTLFFPPSLGRE